MFIVSFAPSDVNQGQHPDFADEGDVFPYGMLIVINISLLNGYDTLMHEEKPAVFFANSTTLGFETRGVVIPPPHAHVMTSAVEGRYAPGTAWTISVPTTGWGGGSGPPPPFPAISITNGRIEPHEAAFDSSLRDLHKAYLKYFKIDLNSRGKVRSEAKFSRFCWMKPR